jgi:6-phosphogluconolactonase (cycloisomerase 2 family)
MHRADQGLNSLIRYDHDDAATAGIPPVSFARTWLFQPSAAPQALALSTNARTAYVSLNASAAIAVFNLSSNASSPVQVLYSGMGWDDRRHRRTRVPLNMVDATFCGLAWPGQVVNMLARLGLGSAARCQGGSLLAHPSGLFLIASVANCTGAASASDRLITYRIQANGTLTFLTATDAQGRDPTALTLDRARSILWVANRRTRNIAAFRYSSSGYFRFLVCIVWRLAS